jgi:hypothetical protein
MPYDRALNILKNPNAKAESLLKAYGDLSMEFGHRAGVVENKNKVKTQTNSETRLQPDCEDDSDTDSQTDYGSEPENDLVRYMIVIKALELRLHQKFKRGA